MDHSAASTKPSAMHGGSLRLGRRLWRQRAAALMLLAPTIWLAILFWRVPAANPLTVSALLLDRIAQAITAVALPLAVVGVAVAPWPVARPAALTGGVASVLLGGFVGLAALRPPVNVWPTMLAALALVCGLGLLTWILRRLLASRSWRISLVAPLALLPLIQF
jgi:hypothetical protein